MSGTGARRLARPSRLGSAWVLLLPVALAFAACESTDGYYGGGGYYGVGYSDPWYYGGADWDDDDIAVPPGARPRPPARPEHPIARPPPMARPMPSIPSRARPAGRR